MGWEVRVNNFGDDRPLYGGMNGVLGVVVIDAVGSD